MLRPNQLTELDLELLEVLALSVPWYEVCGDFHERFGSPGALARRLFVLAGGGYVEIRARDPGAPQPSAQSLEAHALAYDCYRDLSGLREPLWEVVATDFGHWLVRDRLDAQ